VDSSTPSWRVFDAPSGQTGSDHRERGRDPSRARLFVQPLALAAMGVAILVGALAVFVAIGAPTGSAAGPEGSDLPAVSSAERGAVGTLVVDVTGAVATPGVYRLGAGARIGDAIDAAGGFGPRVDAARVAVELNLAAALADGQQVRVPSRDDRIAAGGGIGGGDASGGNAKARIDLNAATQAELESLPGIGPATAGKIIDSRAQSPFRTVDELRERGLVGQKTFDSLRALITVG
jgi:competence protein ComEA